MSAPTSSFSRLTISSSMQSSHTQSGRPRDPKGKGKEVLAENNYTDDEEGYEDEEAEEGEEGEDEGGGGEESGNENDPEPEVNDDEDLCVFALDHCRQTDTDYAFQVACANIKYHGVRISTISPGGPRCSCNQPSCAHITWLLEQLSRSQAGHPGSTALPPTHYFRWITAAGGLESICDTLQWEFRDGSTVSDTEETDWKLVKGKDAVDQSQQTDDIYFARPASNFKTRATAVRDIMATLTATRIDKYRPDIFNNPERIRKEYVKGDFEATMAGILAMDDDIFRHFDNLVPAGQRALKFFRDCSSEGEDILSMMDEYCEVGPPAGQSGQYDVVSCAQKLVDLVSAIGLNLTERQPLTSEVREEAAKTLTVLLTTVVLDRNVDAYQNTTWPRKVMWKESLQERNLCYALIGSGTRSSSNRQPFVLDVLQYLPEAQRFIEQLETVLDRLSQIGWGPAPKAYRDKLGDIIMKLKGLGESGPSASSAASGKRGAGPMDRKVKRMK